MSKKKKSKKKNRPNAIFDSIRKPVPPNSFKLKDKKKSAKADVVGRKKKYKETNE